MTVSIRSSVKTRLSIINLFRVLVITTDDALHTLPIGLAKFVEQYRTRYELMMAGSVVAAAEELLPPDEILFRRHCRA